MNISKQHITGSCTYNSQAPLISGAFLILEITPTAAIERLYRRSRSLSERVVVGVLLLITEKRPVFLTLTQQKAGAERRPFCINQRVC